MCLALATSATATSENFNEKGFRENYMLMSLNVTAAASFESFYGKGFHNNSRCPSALSAMIIQMGL